MQPVVECKDLSKRFGSFSALQNLSLELKPGQAVALLGPNGAGKSTALNLMLGLRQPTNGTVTLFGSKPGHAEVMARVGVTPQATNFPPQLSPVEMLQFTRAHFQAPHSTQYLVETFGLGKFAERRIKGFSGGQLRRTALAMCFAGKPDLVFLDEPTSGLDASGQAEFQKFARKFVDNGGSLILTSHNWREIENVADTIVMIDEGKTVINGSIHEIKAAVAISEISFRCSTPNQLVEETFEFVNGKWTHMTSDADGLVRALVAAGAEFSNLTIKPCQLEDAIDVFRQRQTSR